MKRDALEKLTAKELRSLAQEFGIDKASRLLKEELISALLLNDKKNEKQKDKIKKKTAPIKKNALTKPSTRTRKRISSTSSERGPQAGKGKKLALPSSLVDKTSASSLRVGAPPVAPQSQPPSTNPGLPIPEHYGRDRLILMVQDPQHIFAYWELQGDTVARAMNETHGGSPVLVVYCNGQSELREVDLRGGNYYLAVRPDCHYEAELALRSNQGQVFTLARSNSVHTPMPAVSSRVDERWMSTHDHFSDLLELAGLPDQPGEGEQTEWLNSATRLRAARREQRDKREQRKTTWNWENSSVTGLSSTILSSHSLTNRTSSARLEPKKP
jgi:hypothetical protein